MKFIKHRVKLFPLLLLLAQTAFSQQNLELSSKGYLTMHGLDVTFFADFYPEGHQSGVTIIQHGSRVAANGDLRLEPSPGQWSPVPTGEGIEIDTVNEILSKKLSFPDPKRDRKGNNPIIYPDLKINYSVRIEPLSGSSFSIIVDLDNPVPEKYIGQVGFNLELFPGELFGKTWIMDQSYGIFLEQSGGALTISDTSYISKPMASGKQLIISPDDAMKMISIISKSGNLELRDGRTNHNNGWFIVRSAVPANITKNAISWIVTPNVDPKWNYKPVIQVSQLGYEPQQEKTAIVELDTRDSLQQFRIYRIEKNGQVLVKQGQSKFWGKFLRYTYAKIDFSDLSTKGIYQIYYGNIASHPFRIDPEIYAQNTWQPTLEYFLPVQMCHMRVNEKYRVWHGLCHMDDALMAPINHIHFDGYRQGPSTLTHYEPGEHVPGINAGGWHDAGDYDLRIESQAGTVRMLALMIEEFGIDLDATTIDEVNHVVEIHVPDGKSDAIQQIEHGLAAILGGYHSMGRFYRGIICQDLRQYVMLGDAASMTNNLVFNPESREGLLSTIQNSSMDDDRWVFTEDNPNRELLVAASLAAASRVLNKTNPELSEESLDLALKIWSDSRDKRARTSTKVMALCELILATRDSDLIRELISMETLITNNIENCGPSVGRIIHLIHDASFAEHIENAVAKYEIDLQKKQSEDSPYGVPYKPNIWGAGWNIQQFGVDQYFFHKGWPELAPVRNFENALNFILGVHPGINNKSFVSGVGVNSVTTAYGANRADWSFIPGGVVSGTALIRPDLPEMKEWPFFWQQTEYVMGGGATDFMFLVLAVESLYN